MRTPLAPDGAAVPRAIATQTARQALRLRRSRNSRGSGQGHEHVVHGVLGLVQITDESMATLEQIVRYRW